MALQNRFPFCFASAVSLHAICDIVADCFCFRCNSRTAAATQHRAGPINGNINSKRAKCIRTMRDEQLRAIRSLVRLVVWLISIYCLFIERQLIDQSDSCKREQSRALIIVNRASSPTDAQDSVSARVSGESLFTPSILISDRFSLLNLREPLIIVTSNVKFRPRSKFAEWFRSSFSATH